MQTRALVIAAGVTSLLLACAEPTRSIDPGPAPSCAYLRVEQDRKAVAAEAGVVTLSRAPFTLSYIGPGGQPALHLSSRPELAAPLGLGMASDAGDLIKDDQIEVLVDDGPRKAVTQLVHARYWPMVRERVERAAITVGVRSGLNVSWDAPPGAGSPAVYRVRTLDGVALERTSQAQLHLVAFGEMERVVAQPLNLPMLARARWNACTLRFR